MNKNPEDEFLEQLRNLPIKKPTISIETKNYNEEYNEENGDRPGETKNIGEPEYQSSTEKKLEIAKTATSEIEEIKSKYKDRESMQEYVFEKSKKIAELAIEAVEEMQGDVIGSADGKLAQAYATLIGTASKALDTINNVANEKSRREHDIEMENLKQKNRLSLSSSSQKESKSVTTNNLNIITDRESIMKMIRGSQSDNTKSIEME